MGVRSAKELAVYQKAYEHAMRIFEISKRFPRDCGYINSGERDELAEMCAEIGRMLGTMIQNPKPFLLDSRSLTPDESTCNYTTPSS